MTMLQKSFNILATNLSVLTKLFSDLYPAKLSNTSAKPFFSSI